MVLALIFYIVIIIIKEEKYIKSLSIEKLPECFRIIIVMALISSMFIGYEIVANGQTKMHEI